MEQKYGEIGQRGSRKNSFKKISFKVKRIPSLSRKNIEVHKAICVDSSKVAQLTKKFNEMNSETYLRDNKVLVAFKKKPLNRQSSEKACNTTQKISYRPKNTTNVQNNSDVKDNLRQSLVKDTIKVFEEKSSANHPTTSADTKTVEKIQSPEYCNKTFQNNHNNNNEPNITKEEGRNLGNLNDGLSSELTLHNIAEEEERNSCEKIMEKIIFKEEEADEKSVQVKQSTKLEESIRPNNSFLWNNKFAKNIYSSLKLNTNIINSDSNKCSILYTKILPNNVVHIEAVNPKYTFGNDSYYSSIEEKENFPASVRSAKQLENDLNDGYECFIKPEEHIYEILSFSSYPPATSVKSSLTVNSEHKDKLLLDSCTDDSNRNSLIMSEHNSNSFYGKNLLEVEDDNSTYKAISDISDDWEDVSSNDDETTTNSNIIIIHGKQKSKNLSWTRHFREQRSKGQASFPEEGYDSDHHYESLNTTHENSFDESDSFESDYDDYDDFPDNEKNGTCDPLNSPLPKTPNASLIKFAGKHMQKLRRTFSIDISKSLSRMTRRMSKTNPTTIPEKEKKISVSLESDCENDDTRINSNISEGVYQTIKVSPKSDISNLNEKQRKSLFQRLRRSMTISADSALELTSSLVNKPKSTFYICEITDDGNVEDKKHPVEERIDQVPVTNISELNLSDENIKKSVEIRSDGDVNKIRCMKNREYNSSWYTDTNLYICSDNINSIRDYNRVNSINENKQSDDNFNKQNDQYSSEGINYSINSANIHHLLQDEPLYQFYDAAVADSIYEDSSSSDTCEVEYEDVTEEALPHVRTSISELVVANRNDSFTKTLWCEIPEVVNSSVLSKLSARQKKLQEAKFEIITSEASYLNSLNVLRRHFAASIKSWVSKEDWKILFGKIEQVAKCSAQLLNELEECWKSNILLNGICDVILRHAQENFTVYVDYCENQIVLSSTMKKILKIPGFSDFLKDLESSALCQFLSLYSFLMLPMQRITRWPLLIDAILKRLSESDPECIVCQSTLTYLNKIVNSCNEAARHKEREVEMERISKSLKFEEGVPVIDVVSPNRWLVRSGSVTHIHLKNEDTKLTFGKRFSKTLLHLYLFNDVLFITRKQSTSDMYGILHYCPRNLVEISEDISLSTKKNGNERNTFLLTLLENQEGKSVEYVLSCDKESDKERWIKAIMPLTSENPEETLYETWDCPQVTVIHNYNGEQPDELSLLQGDVINVLRKMSDGWCYGRRINDDQEGWFPEIYTEELINSHVKARNLKQRYRLLAFSKIYLNNFNTFL